MNNQNYKKTIQVATDPDTAIAAVTRDVGEWWTKPDQPLNALGKRAKFTFPPGISFWTFELTGLERPSSVEWTCVDAMHIHEGQPKEIEQEWLGTQVKWSITKTPQGCEIKVEHVGLNRSLLCYEICEAGWDFFLLSSLKQYLDTGQGSPHRGP